MAFDIWRMAVTGRYSEKFGSAKCDSGQGWGWDRVRTGVNVIVSVFSIIFVAFDVGQ